MAVFTAICYVVGCICFLLAVSKMSIIPPALDLLALGLFFCALPTAVERVIAAM